MFYVRLEFPAEAECGYAVGAEVEVGGLSTCLAFEVVIPNAVVVEVTFGVLAGEVLHTDLDAEFSTEVEAFVNVDVDTGEGVKGEEVVRTCVVDALLGSEFSTVDFANCLVCGAGGNELEAEASACVEVNSLEVEEVPLVAEVDREVAFAVLSPVVGVFVGVGGVFVGAYTEADAEAYSVFVREEVAALELVNFKSFEIVGEGVKLNFS